MPRSTKKKKRKPSGSGIKSGMAPGTMVFIGEQRQEQAQRRQRLKPLQDKVRDIDKNLAAERARLADLDTLLADESLYTDPDRKDEVAQLVREQGEARAAIEALEWEWLEASEKLEQAD